MTYANLSAAAFACVLCTTAAFADPLAVAISDTGCTPATLQATAGTVAFDVTNASSGVLEFEVLSGSKILAERENILPGFKQSLSVDLEPGTYAIACGSTSNPQAVLTVTK